MKGTDKGEKGRVIEIDQVKAAADLYNRMTHFLEANGWTRRYAIGGRLNMGDWWYWTHKDYDGAIGMDSAIAYTYEKRGFNAGRASPRQGT